MGIASIRKRMRGFSIRAQAAVLHPLNSAKRKQYRRERLDSVAPGQSPSASRQPSFPLNFTAEEIELIGKVRPFTMTSIHSLRTLIHSVEYIEKNNIPGDIVECGVWRGGSCMMIALSLLHRANTSRKIYLFDTFDGMSQPTDDDIEIHSGKNAAEAWNGCNDKEPISAWCNSQLDEVRANMASTCYPSENVIFIKGKVEDTLTSPAIKLPREIALLRLDTDWYESTKQEMDCLYPRLSGNGVLIVDDYNYWQGSRKAVDEYFSRSGYFPLLQSIEDGGIVTVKSGL